MRWLAFIDIGLAILGVALLVLAYFYRRAIAGNIASMTPVTVVIVKAQIEGGDEGGQATYHWRVRPQHSSEEAWVRVPRTDFQRYGVGDTVYDLIYEHPSEGFLVHYRYPSGRASYYLVYGVMALIASVVLLVYVIDPR